MRRNATARRPSVPVLCLVFQRFRVYTREVNPSRGLTAALLCALLGASAAAHPGPAPAAAPDAGYSLDVPAGRCAAKGGPAAQPITAGPAYDLRAHPLAPEVLALWRRAGFGVDASSSALLTASGRPLPQAEFARLSAPFDGAVDTMTNAAWTALIFTGYRQEGDCRLLDPKQRTPLTRLELMDLERRLRGTTGGSAVEELLVRLAKEDPSRPPSPAVLARMKELEGRGEKLPENLRRALADPRLTAGDLRGKAESLYGGMLRAWDGSRSWADLTEGALPPVEGYSVPGPGKGRIESWESSVGDAFSAEFQGLFSKTASGRELLGRFKDRSGRLDLPKMTVLKMSQTPGGDGYGGALAVYHSESRTVVLNHWYVVAQILASAKPAEREALGARLADSKALAAYLKANPAARAAVADRMDATVFHELTHAWQYRRQDLAVEEARGNAPGGIVLAHEHEAFFAEYRYLHEKLMRDPSAALRTAELPSYLALLNDPEGYRDLITASYQKTIPGSTDFKTLEELQKERRKFLGAPTGGGPLAWARAQLVRAGLARGDDALKRADDDQKATEKRYLTEAIPKMEVEARRRLPDALASLGRPDLSMEVLSALPPGDAGSADRRDAFAAETAVALVHPPAGMDLDARLAAYGLLNAELRREKKPVPPEVQAAYARDARDYTARLVDRVERAPDAAARRAAAGQAHAWLNALPPKDPETVALARRLKAAERSR